LPRRRQAHRGINQNQPPALGQRDNPAIGGLRLIADGFCFGVAYQCLNAPFRRVFQALMRGDLGLQAPGETQQQGSDRGERQASADEHQCPGAEP